MSSLLLFFVLHSLHYNISITVVHHRGIKLGTLYMSPRYRGTLDNTYSNGNKLTVQLVYWHSDEITRVGSWFLFLFYYFS